MLAQTCDIKGCFDNVNQIWVMHHCEMWELIPSGGPTEPYCSFNPYEVEEDKFHCVFRLCYKHADKFRSLQKNKSQDRSEFQFKEDRHKH